jgi:DnaJ domain
VSSKNHYDVLDVTPAAAPDEIKRAFRAQIARYHPDKVQHLGKEFQEMAAVRAAELTEAYRVLSNESQRVEYDRTLHAAAPPPAPASARDTPSERASSTPMPPPASDDVPRANTFAGERAGRDQFLRRAAMARVRQALGVITRDYEEEHVRGFDIALVPKNTLFGSGKRPRLFGRFIEAVDGPAVVDAWAFAVRSTTSPNEEICVLLLGSSVAPPRELANAIGEQRRRNPAAKFTIIPVDVRNWTAHIPVDTPAVCRDLLGRLKSGN